MTPVTVNGKWEIILPDHRADRGEVWDWWEAERLASMHEHLDPGDVVYDVGAEEGDMPGLWASWGCQVVMFEPNPKVWPNIKAIWEANEFPRPLACFVGFCGDREYDPVSERLDGTGWYFLDWPPAADGPLIGDHGFLNLSERPDVPVIRIDQVARMSTHPGIPLRPPTAITIDVEGSEFQVLSGANETLREHRPLVWVSIHPDFMAEMHDTHPDQIHSLMATLDYRGKMLADDHEQHWFYWPAERNL